MKLKELVGWIGVVLILFGYTLITLGIIEPKSITYGLINLLGALGIIISSYYKRDYQPVILNVIWLIVAIIGITRSIL